MKIAVIGGGAAGQLAAIEAAKGGHEVHIFEKNEKLGKKLFLTGKGRCNLTNACDREDFFANVAHNPRFLYSALAAFDQNDIIEFMHQNGVPTKVERGGRVFPESDKSSDVLRALARECSRQGVIVHLNTAVSKVLAQEGRISGIVVQGESLAFDAVIMASGGVSYPQTGSTGEGLRMAQSLGHTIMPTRGALVPLTCQQSWCKELSGVTLKNVVLRAKRDKELVYSELGELLFTHFGVSGPLVLSLSSIIADQPQGVKLEIDFKPALSFEQLDARLLRDLQTNQRKSIQGALGGLLPQRLLLVILNQAEIDPLDMVSEFTKVQRHRLIDTLKAMPLDVTGTGPIAEAIITRGGVSVKEVNSSTMESRKIKGLFFCGEMLDVDAFTGGFNLQIAWSTGALAGRSV